MAKILLKVALNTINQPSFTEPHW